MKKKFNQLKCVGQKARAMSYVSSNYLNGPNGRIKFEAQSCSLMR